MVQASEVCLKKKRMGGGCKILFVSLYHGGGEGSYRPSSLRGDDRCGRIVGMIGMSDRVMRRLELGLIPYMSCCKTGGKWLTQYLESSRRADS